MDKDFKDNLLMLYNIYPILKEINDSNDGIIERRVHFKIVEAEEAISSAKETCREIIMVMKGNVNIKRINGNGDETNLYNISGGDLCHEAFSCLLHSKQLNIIGCAVQKSLICLIPIEIVKKYLLGNSRFMLYMYEDIFKKFNILIEKREDKNHKSLKERILTYLIEKNSRIVYATHKDIAYELDSKREVVSRKLKEIEKSGFIEIKRGKIVILKDLKELLLENRR